MSTHTVKTSSIDSLSSDNGVIINTDITRQSSEEVNCAQFAELCNAHSIHSAVQQTFVALIQDL